MNRQKKFTTRESGHGGTFTETYSADYPQTIDHDKAQIYGFGGL